MATLGDLQIELAALKKQYEDKQAVVDYNIDTFFIIIVSIIIYFMQAGFAFLECGCVRSKNATNILLKNILDSFLGCFAYWIVGWPLAFGSGNSFIGWTNWMSHDMDESQYNMFFFHFVFAATAATIVSGSVAERCEFYAYIAYSIFITGIVYPVVTHWAWSSDGWLAKGVTIMQDGEELNVAYRDFAGSGVVHLLGGTAALVGAIFLGPRIGRFQEGLKVALDIKGHSVPLTAFGGFILVFGFFAFNAGSQASISQEGDGEAIAIACVNTVMAASSGALASMIANNIIIHFAHDASKWSLLTTLNGALCAMVSVCAGCNVYYPWASVVIGSIAGLLYLGGSWTIVKLRIDDPLDAVAVHGVGGLWGVIAVPIFAKENSLIFGGDKEAWTSLGWNVAGGLSIIAWSGGLSIVIFGFLTVLDVYRVNPTIEINGLDIPKHGEPAYPLESYGDGWTDEDGGDKADQSNIGEMKKSGWANNAALFRLSSPKTREQFFPELLADIKGNANDTEVRAKLKQAFDEVDTDSSGSLSYDEIEIMMTKAGFKANETMIKKIIKAVDADHSGSIEFEEFIVFFMELGPKIQVALRLQNRFDELDKDNTGFITRKQLKKALKKEGNLTARQIEDFVKSADRDGDGQISLEEWLDVMLEDVGDKSTAKALMIEKNEDHIVVNLPNDYTDKLQLPVGDRAVSVHL